MLGTAESSCHTRARLVAMAEALAKVLANL